MIFIIFSVVIILLLDLIIYRQLTTPKKNIEVKECCDKPRYYDVDWNFDYCPAFSNRMYNICPLNNMSNSTIYGLNMNGQKCSIKDLNIYSTRFIGGYMNDIQGCYFGYSGKYGTVFEKCIFNSIKNTTFQKCKFYKRNTFYKVILQSVNFDSVHFYDKHYLFEIQDSDCKFFSNIEIACKTVMEFVGIPPVYVNTRINVEEQMEVDGVYLFGGYRYYLKYNDLNKLYTLVPMSDRYYKY